jgi:hypothetical protein
MVELEDLADKILKSESHRSFATESWVRETISGLRSTAVQGAIYQDPVKGNCVRSMSWRAVAGNHPLRKKLASM